MTRVTYPDIEDETTASLVQRIRAERGSVPNLYRMLLHCPPVAEGWLAFLTAIRQKSSLSAYDRELAVLHVAALNRANYEFHAHEGFAREAGLSILQVEALRNHELGPFDARDRLVLAYCAAMTLEIQVPAEVFEAVKASFDTRQLVELTATVAAYNLVTRFQEAIQMGHE